MSIFLDISYISKNKSMKTIEDIKDNWKIILKKSHF